MDLALSTLVKRGDERARRAIVMPVKRLLSG
jgi:hypothetical protein